MKKIISIKILYADADNVPILKGRGWISYFEKFLFMMLKQTTDHPFHIHLISESEPDLKTEATDILIPILSPEFNASGICMDQMESLLFTASQSSHKLPVMKVFKSALPSENEPHSLKAYNGYHLYLNEENNKREISEFFGLEAEKNYWMKMVDLCFDIYEAMIFIASENRIPPTSVQQRKCIYLADCGQDINGARNIIKRELLRHGYEVLPKTQLPMQADPLINNIKQDLASCEFSIHLFGSSYGKLTNDSPVSIADLQNSVAAEKSATHPDQLQRLIWISPSIKFASEKQKTFIHNLKTDSEASAGAEILETSYEDFKNTIWEQLLNGGHHKNDHNLDSKSAELPIVYLIYDPIDQNKVQPVIQLLTKSKIKIITPSFRGDLMSLRNEHINALKQMDAAIVFQHFVNPKWAQIKLLDLLKAPGFGRKKPLIGKLFLTQKAKTTAAETETQYEVLVDHSEVFEKLDTFISEIESAHNLNTILPS